VYLGDCYKLQIFALAKYINRDKEIIPSNIITKPPSAELAPTKKTLTALPPYEILDQVLYQYIERRQGPNEIKHKGLMLHC
jgi:NAD+ synthase (glutamine-hydrolysing)